MIADEMALVASTYRSPDPLETANGEIDAEGLSLSDLCALRSRLEQIASAARTVKQVVDERITAELGENGEVRFGDRLFRARAPNKWKLKDVDEFCEWAGSDLKELVNLTYALRITSLRALAKRRGLSEKTVLDTFGEWEKEDAKLTVIPIDRAPPYAQRMENGERNFKKGTTDLSAGSSRSGPEG